jgi:hypothetical protein
MGLNLGTGAVLFGKTTPGLILIVAGILGLAWILTTGGLARRAGPKQGGPE